MLTGPNVILLLKFAVATVTVLFVTSLICLALGRIRWHGRINIVFFALTMAAVLGLELLVRVIDPTVFDYFDERTRRLMTIHLCFSIPSTILMPLMLFSGLSSRRRLHIGLGVLFLMTWTGTFVTGIFFLPH